MWIAGGAKALPGRPLAPAIAPIRGSRRCTLLAREWNGRLERVMILEKGVAWNGKTYGSLSQVAKAMTGTSWNGHRFFGLQTAKSDRPAMVPRRSRVCETASSDAASTPIGDGGAVFAGQSNREAASP